MLNYSDHFEDITVKNTFFAGANTPRGFEGDYDKLFSEESFDKIYMVKGGAGTGKSTLIGRCATACAEKGACLTYIKCSSDPDSLDGVIIEKGNKKIAVIDSTAPHVTDRKYPGACSEIVDCGEFWDSAQLEKRREEIILYSKNKSASYERAYRYLSAAGELFRMQQRLADTVLMKDKMEKAINRLCDGFVSKNDSGEVLFRRTQCISMKGAFRLSSFENEKTLFGVRDYSFLSPIFFELLKTELLKRGLTVEVSVSPVFGICEIHIPSERCSFVPFRNDKEFYKCVNLARFANTKKAQEVKQKRLFSSRCLVGMLEGALESLEDAGKAHFLLEDIYKSAMDFDALDIAGKALEKNISDRL
ncbi:MAG: hypothetical protein IJA52_01110 [Clostridia bacterium]|nr:hypothetical protein [Clostridia bacterium]